MSEPVATIVRFNGDPDDLLERFEAARRSWIDAQEDYCPPAFYAACRADAGIVIAIGWQTDADHKAFGRLMGPHLKAVGAPTPSHVEHLKIAKLGWRSRSAGEP